MWSQKSGHLMQAQTLATDGVEDVLVHVKPRLPVNVLSKHSFRSFVDPKVLKSLELHVTCFRSSILTNIVSHIQHWCLRISSQLLALLKGAVSPNFLCYFE